MSQHLGISMPAAPEAIPTDGPEQADRQTLVETFEQNRDRLRRMISLRLDRRLAQRIDPSDIVQETYLRAEAAFDEYQRQSNLPLYAWLRIQAQFAVGDCHRTHLATQKRAAGCETPQSAEDTFSALEHLAVSMISPGSEIANRDLAEQIRMKIAGMPEMDREILFLRHIEELSISESAMALGISVDTAKKRHLRAVRRLQQLCQTLAESHQE